MLPDNVKPGSARRTVSRLGRTGGYPRYLTATVRQVQGRAFFVVAASTQIPVAGAIQYEPMSRMVTLAVSANIPSQPNFERYDRASQTTARLIRNGQAYYMLILELPRRLFSHHGQAAPDRQGTDYRFGRNTPNCSVMNRHTATQGNDADRFEGGYSLNHRPRSRSLNRASLAWHVPQNIAANSTKTLRSVSLPHRNCASSSSSHIPRTITAFRRYIIH